MKGKGSLAVLACVGLCSLSTSAALGNALILKVPDWNQPNSYAVPIGPGGGYPDWCVPTSSGNVMGYWEDVKGKTGLADRSAYPAVPPFNPPFNYPANVNTWQQGLFIDGAVELGWQLDTHGWRTAGGPFPPSPPLAGGTPLININPQVTTYAQAAWADPGGLNKLAYQATVTTDAFGANMPLANMWNTYQAEIDAGRPALCSFDFWVIPDPNGQTGRQWQVNGQQVFEYGWNILTDPHTVAGVGYIDLNPGAPAVNDDWFITQDTWGNTTRYVAVPVVDLLLGAGQPPWGPTVWRQNDYVTIGLPLTYIPEPASVFVTALGMAALLGYVRRRGAK